MTCPTCQEEPCICEHLPQHVKELMRLQHSEHGQYYELLMLWLYLFIALVFFIGAWSAGYSPWWFLKNILIWLEVLHA